jgi:hypothetical protein
MCLIGIKLAHGCLAQPLDDESQDAKALALEIEERL